MHTPDEVSVREPSEGMVPEKVPSCIVPYGSLVRPFHVVAIVCVHSVGLCIIGDDDGLEGVGLYGSRGGREDEGVG